MRTTQQLYAGGKITVPVTIRDELGLKDGDLVEIEVRPVQGSVESPTKSIGNGGDFGG